MKVIKSLIFILVLAAVTYAGEMPQFDPDSTRAGEIPQFGSTPTQPWRNAASWTIRCKPKSNERRNGKDSGCCHPKSLVAALTGDWSAKLVPCAVPIVR